MTEQEREIAQRLEVARAEQSKPPKTVWAYFSPFMGEWSFTSDETEAAFMSATTRYVITEAPAPKRPCDGKSHRFGCPYDDCPTTEVYESRKKAKRKRSKAK